MLMNQSVTSAPAGEEDQALMMRIGRGDKEAFSRLYDRHRRRMLSFCYRVVRRRELAEELTQEIFLKIFQSAPRYEPVAKFKTWLYRVALNHCLNEIRRPEHAEQFDSLDQTFTNGEGSKIRHDLADDSSPSPLEQAAGHETAQSIWSALAELPENQRTSFILCRLEDLSYAEIAETMLLSESAVKSLIHRATVTLRDTLHQDKKVERE